MGCIPKGGKRVASRARLRPGSAEAVKWGAFFLRFVWNSAFLVLRCYWRLGSPQQTRSADNLQERQRATAFQASPYALPHHLHLHLDLTLILLGPIFPREWRRDTEQT
jgi:hypothetical protein